MNKAIYCSHLPKRFKLIIHNVKNTISSVELCESCYNQHDTALILKEVLGS